MAVLNWQQIVGHDDKITRLRSLIAEDKMPHALLIAGPEGVGKFLVAQVTAAAIFCSSTAMRPCGTCTACRAMADRTHPDLTVVEPEGQTIKIEQIRELQTKMALAPYLGSYRLAILRQAEKLTLPAANSLLKMIEEPASKVIYLLLTNNWQAMLVTILSRCRRLDLQPLAQEAMLPVLMEHNLSLDKAKVIARLAEGSIGRALAMISNDELAVRDSAVSLLQKAVSNQTMTVILQQSTALGDIERQQLHLLLMYCRLLLRDLLALHEGSELLYNSDCLPQLQQLMPLWQKERVFPTLHEISYLERTLNANVNQRLAVERFLIKVRDL